VEEMDWAGEGHPGRNRGNRQKKEACNWETREVELPSVIVRRLSINEAPVDEEKNQGVSRLQVACLRKHPVDEGLCKAYTREG